MPTLKETAHSHAKRWHGQGLVRDEYLQWFLENKVVTLAEYQELRANSYERFLIYHLLDDEALASVIEYAVKNTGGHHGRHDGPPYSVYDDNLAFVLSPIMVERLRRQVEVRRSTRNAINKLVSDESIAPNGYPTNEAVETFIEESGLKDAIANIPVSGERKEAYEFFAAAWKVQCNGDVTATCEAATDLMVTEFPELTRVRGQIRAINPPPFERSLWPHWWCLTPNGEIVDPTKEQFWLLGDFTYEPHDESKGEPTGRCLNCGELAYDHRFTCSDKCETEYAAYCTNPDNHPGGGVVEEQKPQISFEEFLAEFGLTMKDAGK